ncbi:MAG: UDP-glucose 4-epimerase GalE [Clostridia bacterium]|nr:UDP-glucose 4-epimerase GalE [Clostridia bacterium]
MKILLTGGAGYIGSHTCVELLEAGYDVVSVDNYCNSQPEALRRVETITGKKVTAYEADVCDKAALETIFAAEKPDAVIHFAGLKAVGESVEKPLSYYRNNIDSTLALLETMKKYGCTRIVFSSSATVYGQPDTLPVPETARLGCSSPYGWTKYMIEQILRDEAFADKALSVVLLRYFNPVGAHPSGLIGENPNGRPNNLMPNVLNAASGKVKELSVFGGDYDTPDGTCVRDYIHVVDLAKGHVCAIRYAMEHTGSEAINLGTGVGYSVLDIIGSFEKTTGVKVPYVMAERRPGDIPAVYANPEKAARLLGWRTEKTLDDMCRDSWAFKTKNPNGYEA